MQRKKQPFGVVDIPVLVAAVNLSDVNGSLIGFSRQRNDASLASLVYDVSTATLTDVAPVPGSSRFSVVVGNHVVAFAEFSSGNGDVMVYDLGTAGGGR